MGFLRKLFGGDGHDGRDGRDGRDSRSGKAAVDTQGVYFYVQCDRCGTPVRLRADKQYDLINEGNGYVWHKTIVDNRCFRPMPTVVYLNSAFEVISSEIEGGRYITEEEYDALRSAPPPSAEE